jgi:hypothetical protein
MNDDIVITIGGGRALIAIPSSIIETQIGQQAIAATQQIASNNGLEYVINET